MPIISPFVSFHGRITRRTFWVGLIVLAFASPFAFSTIISADPFGELVQTAQTSPKSFARRRFDIFFSSPFDKALARPQ